MDILDAIIIGIVQGLTEFLPVSSSGHIELSKAILSDDSMPKEGMLFTIVLHMATALSTVVIFRKDIIELFKGLLKFKWNDETKFALCVLISMVPAAFIGLFFEDEIDRHFNGNVLLVGIMLLITGLLLFLADRAKNTTKGVGKVEAAIIGISQGIAILPGISRSGATIGTSVLLGIDRSKAAKFSFLMVIPLICGAMLVKTKKFLDVNELESMSASERTTAILDKIEEDYPDVDKSQVEYSALTSFIKQRESLWEKQKLDPNFDFQEETAFRKNYNSSIAALNISAELTEELKTDEKIGLRTHFKTSGLNMFIGFLAAFITGIFACQWMIALVKKSQLKYFSYYCFLVGTIAIIHDIAF